MTNPTPPPADQPSGEASGTSESVRRSALFAGAVQLSGTVFTAILTLYLVRALGRADYGRFSIALAVGAIVLLPTDFGISPSAARSLAQAFGDRERIFNVFSVALRLKFCLSVLSGCLVFLSAPLIARIYGDSDLTWPLRVTGVAVAAQSMLAFAAASFTALRRMRAVFGMVTFESIAETTTSIALVAGGAGVVGAVTGRAIGYVLGAGVGLTILVGQNGGLGKVVRAHFDRGLARAMALYAGAIAVVDVIWAILSQVDVLIMGVFLSPGAVASFQAPSRLLSLATYPGLALSNALGPRLASEGSTPQTLVTTARRLVVVQAFAGTCCLLYARQIVHIALGASYVHTSAPSVVRVLAPFVMLSGLAPLLSNAIDYVGGARRRIKIAAVTLGINVILNVALVPRIGPVGAAIAVDAGFGVFVVAHIALGRRLLDLAVRGLGRSTGAALLAGGSMAVVAFASDQLGLGAAGIVAGGVAGAVVFAVVIAAADDRHLWRISF